MADLEQIIAQSVKDATESGDTPDAEYDSGNGPGDENDGSGGEADGQEASTGENEPENQGNEAETVEQKAAKEAAKEASAEAEAQEQEFQTILKELGINPKPSGRDNRMPYSRYLRTLVNTVKKDRARLGGEHTKVLTERDAKAAAAEAELARFREVDAVAGADPDKYIGILAALYPDKYKKFLTPGEAKTVSDQQLAEKKDPMPEPDLRYQDGTVGFSPEQWVKREEWNRREAVREAGNLWKAEKAELEQRFGSILKREEATQAIQQRLPQIRANISNAKQVWGDELYNANETAILDALKAEDAKAAQERRVPLPFAAVAASVLAPKLHERANKARELAMAELKKAPKAASTSGAGTKPQQRDPNEERDLEDVIRESIAGMKR